MVWETQVSIEEAQADIEVVDISAPNEAKPGETVTVEATIKNVGNVQGKRTITMGTADEDIKERSFSLAPGAEFTMSGQVTIDSRVVTVFVGGENVAIDREEQEPDISFEATAPRSVASNSTFSVEITATNDGNASGSGDVTVMKNGSPAGTATFFLDAGESDTKSVSLSAPSSDFTVSVGGERLSISVEKPDISISAQMPNEVAKGSQIQIEVTAKNKGNARGSKEVEVSKNGGTVKKLTFDLNANSSNTKTVTTKADSDNIQIGVNGKTTSVNVLKPNLSIRLSVPNEARLGSQIPIRVTASNTGGAEANKKVTITKNGSKIEELTFTVSPGNDKTQTVKTNVDKKDITIGANGKETTVKVLEPKIKITPSIPNSVKFGTKFDVSVEAKNEGDAQGTTKVPVKKNGNTIEELAFSLLPGESKTKTISILAAKESLNIEVGESKQTVQGVEPDVDISASIPNEAEFGKDFVVTVTVSNTGSVSANVTIPITKNGSNVDTLQVAIPPGGTKEETVAITANEEPLNVSVGDTSKSVVVKGKETPGDRDRDDGGNGDDGDRNQDPISDPIFDPDPPGGTDPGSPGGTDPGGDDTQGDTGDDGGKDSQDDKQDRREGIISENLGTIIGVGGVIGAALLRRR